MDSIEYMWSGCPPRHHLGGGAEHDGKLVMQSVLATQATILWISTAWIARGFACDLRRKGTLGVAVRLRW